MVLGTWVIQAHQSKGRTVGLGPPSSLFPPVQSAQLISARAIGDRIGNSGTVAAVVRWGYDFPVSPAPLWQLFQENER
jgi:hypothetical protein